MNQCSRILTAARLSCDAAHGQSHEDWRAGREWFAASLRCEKVTGTLSPDPAPRHHVRSIMGLFSFPSSGRKCGIGRMRRESEAAWPTKIVHAIVLRCGGCSRKARIGLLLLTLGQKRSRKDRTRGLIPPNRPRKQRRGAQRGPGGTPTFVATRLVSDLQRTA